MSRRHGSHHQYSQRVARTSRGTLIFTTDTAVVGDGIDAPGLVDFEIDLLDTERYTVSRLDN